MTTATARVPSTNDLVRSYLRAKRAVIDAGYARELDWQRTRRTEKITDTEFVRESAWVVLSAGMRETVVRSVFPRVAAVLHDFVPHAVCCDPTSRVNAMRIFGHARKIDAILIIAAAALQLGTNGIRSELARDALGFVNGLPYMGPATSRHLAKNLGVSVAKPDRHLLRLAISAGRTCPERMCQEIGSWMGEPVCVVDIVLWRWATMHARECSRPSCDGLPHD